MEEVQTPEPGPKEVLIEVNVAGVNFADVGMRAGMMGGPHAVGPPYTPGFKAAGVVAAIGQGAGGVAEGDRVAAVLPTGGYAEYAVAPAGSVVRAPDGVGFADASALLVQGLTAYGVLHDSARVREGEAVLVRRQAAGRARWRSRHAAERGREWPMSEALFRGYFAEVRNLTSPDDLAAMAAAAGLDADEVRAFLAGDSGTQDVWESQRTAAGLGIGGVPFYAIDGRYAVSGGQPAEVWLRTLDAIEAERVP